VAPSGVGGNEYYPTEAAYLDAVADALHEEYAAIVAAGFTLQTDDPFLTDVFSYGAGSRQDTLERARLYVSAINRSLRGIPPERVRLHTRRSSGPSSSRWPRAPAGPPPGCGPNPGFRSRTGRRRWWRAPPGRRCGPG
jgi:methionine synthase II (cobalamin-independent)